MRVAVATLALSLTALALTAQAPVITPSGDPSIRSDTIYRLAVDPAGHPGDDYVYLLDDGVVRFEKDGTGSRTYRQVVQVLTREGAEAWGEQTFSYDASRERLRINWIRVLAPDGRVISDKPVHEQESLAPVAQDAPVYSDEKIHRVSLGGVAPNTLVDYSYTVETIKPVMPGDFETSWSVMTGKLTRRSRLIVDVPADVTPRIDERNLTFKRRETVTHGRHVYEWAAADVPKIEAEPFAADSNGILESIDVTAPVTWGDVARWYAALSADRYGLTPALDSALAATVAGARTRDDSLRAVDRWVAQDFRYVSLSLGIGGYQPRHPADVFATKYGDCKDKATLFIALARRMGFDAFPVLLNSAGGVNRKLPTTAAFDHMIAAVRDPGATHYRFFDLTSDLTPYGSLPPAEHGEFGLVVRNDGTPDTVTFPRDSIAANRDDDYFVAALDTDGTISGWFTDTTTGASQYGLRDAFTTVLDSEARARLADALASSIVPGASGDSVRIFDGRDWNATPAVTVHLTGRGAAARSGTHVILTLPLHDYATPSTVTNLESRGPRRFPIDAGDVYGAGEQSSTLVLTLPAGWKAELPPEVSATSVFGSYRATYAQAGRELRIVRRVTGARGIQPPDRIGELIAFLKAVAQDDVKYVVIDRGP